ncbi:MAG: caspase family protein [Brumimicrobium sp.]
MKRALTSSILILLSGFVLSQEAKLVTQQRIRGTITDFKFSPDSDYLANISEGDASINVWHLSSQKIVGSFQEYSEEVKYFSFNSSGNELVSIHSDNLVIRWSLDDWSLKDSIRLDYQPDMVDFSENHVFIGKYGEVTAYSPDFSSKNTFKLKGKPASSHIDKTHLWLGTDSGELSKINLKSLEVEVQKNYKKTDFADIDVSVAKDRIVSLNDDGSVSTIMLNSMALAETIKPLSGINFGSQYGKIHAGAGLIAYISEKNQVDCYNLEGNLVFQLIDTVEAEEIKVLEFSSDGSVLCSSSFKERLFLKTKATENSIKIWDLNRQGLIGELKGTVNPVNQFSFHPEQNIVALLGEDHSISLWDVDYAEKLFDFQLEKPKREQKIALMDDEDKREVNNSTRTIGGSKVLNVDKLKDKVIENSVRRSVNRKLRKEPVLLQFSSKGNYLITKLDNDEVRIYKFDGQKLEYLHYAEHQQERINKFITDPEEKHLICMGAGDEAVSVVELKTGELKRKLKTKNKNSEYEFLNNAISGAYNPNGNNFAVCTGRGQIFVWNSSFTEIFKTEGNNIFRAGANAFINYSADGSKLYMKGIDGVRGYDIKTLNPLETNKLKMPGRPYSLDSPQDFMVGFDENTGYIEDLSSSDLVDFKINSGLINAVDASTRGYIGIALKNGEFRLVDVKSGKLLATFVGEGENTIIKTEENYYKVNKEGFDLVSFRIGRKAYPFEQFDAYYNRPDIVLAALKCPDEEYIELYENAHERRLNKLNITNKEAPDFSTLPQLKIANRSNVPFSQKEKNLTLNLKASSNGKQLKKIKITINNVPVEEKAISGNQIDESIDIELISGLNKVNVIVIDESGQESLAESVSVNCLRKDKPTLYLITVGTSDYKDERYSLNYAAKDAMDLKSLFTKYDKGNFAEVKTISLTNEEVQKEAFGKLKTFLDPSQRNDQVIFYIAGHGVLDEDYDYYYGTHDIDFLSPQQRGLAYDKLEDILTGIAPVKKLLIMDTCHSGEVEADEVSESDDQEDDLAYDDVTFRAVGPKLQEGTETRASAGKMARLLFADIRKGTGATVISSAGGVEFAMEGDDWKNGLFTYCLLNGMTNKTADLDNNGTIMLSELQTYLIDKVGKLSHGKQVPTTRVQNIRLDYPVW